MCGCFGLIIETKDLRHKHGYIRVSFENLLTAYDHERRGSVNYHFNVSDRRTGARRSRDEALTEARGFQTHHGGELRVRDNGQIYVHVPTVRKIMCEDCSHRVATLRVEDLRLSKGWYACDKCGEATMTNDDVMSGPISDYLAILDD